MQAYFNRGAVSNSGRHTAEESRIDEIRLPCDGRADVLGSYLKIKKLHWFNGKRDFLTMPPVNLTIATWDYDRVRPIMDGRVKVQRCEINFINGPPEECFHRAWNYQEFDITEI